MNGKLWGASLGAFLLAGGLSAVPAEAKRVKDEVDLSRLDDKQIEEAVEFVVGNAIFVMFHEGGHMLISELDLPVLGREEDAVDALSSIMLLEARDDTLDKAMTDATDGWFLAGDKAEATGSEPAFWDSHGLDRQRAYQMVCMMVGHDADGFKEYADSIDFPASRREECVAEYERTRTSWISLLAPHMVEEGEASSSIAVSYRRTSDPDLALYADWLKSGEILEAMAGALGEIYRLEGGIKLIARSCGEPNAFWNAGTREMTYCYELARHHMLLVSEWLLDHEDE